MNVIVKEQVIFYYLSKSIPTQVQLTPLDEIYSPRVRPTTHTTGCRQLTGLSSGKLVFQIFGALAEFERNLIRERTQAGLAAARARGRKGGRPKALDKDQIERAYRLYDEKELPIKEICKLLGISKPTLYTYLHQKVTTRTG